LCFPSDYGQGCGFAENLADCELSFGFSGSLDDYDQSCDPVKKAVDCAQKLEAASHWLPVAERSAD
jgi:hypothetical protein